METLRQQYARKFGGMDAETFDRELAFARGLVDQGMDESRLWLEEAELERRRRQGPDALCT